MSPLDELQQQWKRLDEKLERALVIEHALLRQSMLPPIRRRLSRFAMWPIIDILFCGGVLLGCGSFLWEHRAHWSLGGPAVVVMAGTVALLASSIHQWILIAQIDWGGTVVAIQFSLARLRKAILRQFQWIILFSPLVGFNGLLVGLQWLLDRLQPPISILDKVSFAWIVGNWIFGVLFVFLGVGAIRFVSRQLRWRGWWQRMADEIAGHSLSQAHGELVAWGNLDRMASEGATLD